MWVDGENGFPVVSTHACWVWVISDGQPVITQPVNPLLCGGQSEYFQPINFHLKQFHALVEHLTIERISCAYEHYNLCVKKCTENP